jgi:hypothetical protein
VSHGWIAEPGRKINAPCYNLPLVIDLSTIQMLLMVLTGWLDRREREALAYLVEENRLLRRQLGGRRLRLTDEDR